MVCRLGYVDEVLISTMSLHERAMVVLDISLRRHSSGQAEGNRPYSSISDRQHWYP